MDFIEQQFTVPFRYRVYFTREVFARSNSLLATAIASTIPGQPSRVLFIVDDGVSRAHPNVIHDIEEYCRAHATALAVAGRVLVVSGGEQAKNDSSVADTILEAIHAASLCRHSYVAAIGGGAVLDVAGYAAATVHRGVRLIRLPTTVLAQDDSGVGVKNGINRYGQKNYLGTFAPPFAVINDFSFLTTLSDRDWRGGVAEAVKASLIKEAGFFDFIEAHAAALSNRDMHTMETVIRRCAELHLRHIASGGDPFEMGSSRPLDFGHWAAHKLENMTGYRLRHGEAVAIGMALDALYSARVGLCGAAVVDRMIGLLRALGFKLWDVALLRRQGARPAVLDGLEDFREHLGGQLTVTLLEDIGRGREVHSLDHALIERCIGELEARSGG
jgi:3-dehydroquinate synthase